MRDVIENKDAGSLLAHYRNVYKLRFSVLPADKIQGLNQTLCRDIIRSLQTKEPGEALKRGKELLSHYVTIPDDWFTKKGYSLECFIANISGITLSWGKRYGEKEFVGSSIDVRLEIACFEVGCKATVDVYTTSDSVDNAALGPHYCVGHRELSKIEPKDDEGKDTAIW